MFSATVIELQPELANELQLFMGLVLFVLGALLVMQFRR